MTIFKPFQGAGILFVHESGDAPVQVFLGKRNYPPFKNYWSIAGGRMELADRGDYFRAALREASEETCGGIRIDRYLRDYLSLPLKSDSLEKQEIDLPFFKFVTYFLPLNSIPSRQVWPKLNFEFTDGQWFSSNCLPRPLHPFVHTPKLSGIGK